MNSHAVFERIETRPTSSLQNPKLSAVSLRSNQMAVWFSYPALLYAIVYPAMRPLGATLLLVVVFSSFVAMALSRTVAVNQRYVPFGMYSFTILLLSIAGLMPDGWTIYQNNWAALRHWVWVLIFPAVATSFFIVFERHWQTVVRHSLVLALVCFAMSRFSRLFAPSVFANEAEYYLYTLTNDTVFVYLMIFIHVFVKAKMKLYRLAILIGVLVVSSSTQSQILVLVGILIVVISRPRLVTYTLFAMLVLYITVTPMFPFTLHELDPNSGIRAMFWRDTWVAIFQTYGAGVGYGTEYVTNNFTALKHSFWTIVPEESDGRLFVGTHSAFYDVLLRNGIMGLVFFLFWYVPEVLRQPPAQSPQAKLFAIVVAVLLISNLVNMGFTSMNFLFAASACFGLLACLRKKERMSGAVRLEWLKQ